MDRIQRRTRYAAYAMVLGGIALAVPPWLSGPNGANDTRQRLEGFVADPHPAMAKSLVFQLAVLLLLPGLIAWVGRAHGRGAVAMFLGAGTAAITTPFAMSFMLLSGLEVSIAGDGPVNDTLVGAADRMGSSPAAIPTYVGCFLLWHLLAMPIFSFGLVRSRQVPVWLGLAPAIGMLMAFFGSGSPVERFGWVVLGLALCGLGVALVRPRVPAVLPAEVPVTV